MLCQQSGKSVECVCANDSDQSTIERYEHTEKTAASHGGFTDQSDSFFQISARSSTVGHESSRRHRDLPRVAHRLWPAILGAVPADGSITAQGIAAGTALVAGVMTVSWVSSPTTPWRSPPA